MGDVLDLLHVAGHPVLADAPELGLAVVVGDEERGVGQTGVVVALRVVGRLDRHVVGLAFDHDQSVVSGPALSWAVRQITKSARAWPEPAAGDFLLLVDLIEGEAVLVEHDIEECLPHALLGRLHKPLLPQTAEYLVAADLDLIRLGIRLRWSISSWPYGLLLFVPQVLQADRSRSSCNARTRRQSHGRAGPVERVCTRSTGRGWCRRRRLMVPDCRTGDCEPGPRRRRRGEALPR